MIDPVDVFYKTALANPHTVHCIPGGKIMISTMGDPEGNSKGDTVIIFGYKLLDVGHYDT